MTSAAPVLEPAACAAADRARALMEQASPADLPRDAGERCAVAWALKDLCYTAWSSQPQRAVLAAQALRTLAAQPTEGGGAQLSEVEALADWTAGIAAVTLGRLADAVAALERAHDAFLRLGRSDHAAATQVPRVMVLSLLGRYDDAVACAEQARQRFVTLGDRRSAAKVSLNLGSMCIHRGDAAQAARHSRAAAVLFARVGDHEHSIMADINFARAQTVLGDFDESLRIYARAAMRASAHAFPVLRTLVEEAVAFVQLARGQYAQALAGFEGARRRYEVLGMVQEQAVAEKQLADTYVELRLLPEALGLLDQSLERFRTLGLADEEAWTLTQRGRVLALRGKPDDALGSFLQAAGLFAAQGNASGEAAVLLARAELALAAGQAGPALELALHAGRSFIACGQLDSVLRADTLRARALHQAGSVEQARALFEDALRRARELHLLPVQVQCLTGLGLSAQGRGDSLAARAAFADAVALFEEQRRTLPDAGLRSAFLGDHLRPYQELLRLALDEHAREPGDTSATQVLRTLDRHRARALAPGADRSAAAAPTDEAATTRAQRTRLNWLYRAVESDQGEGHEALVDELRRTEHALLEAARRDRLARGPQSAAEDEALDVAALQRALGPHEALVEYGVLDDELFACVVDRGGVVVHRRLARWGDVLEALRSARFQIESLRNGAGPVEAHLQQLIERARVRLKRLHSLVWRPLAPSIEAHERVLVVPHGQLGSLPFAALEDESGPLGERHALAVAPSARLALRGLACVPVPARHALVLGESSHLPQAAVEAHNVAALLGDASTATGADATLACLQRGAAQADVIHLACHARFRSDNPNFSALQLADGALTVDLVEQLRLRPCTVVLSGCETGLADVGSGHEMVGLVRAFMVAGAARVVASLWAVDDAVTAGFMAHFYRALRGGAGSAGALVAAQRAVRECHPHPLHWAAFTLYGGW